MAVTEQALLTALATVRDPYTEQDYVSTRALRNVRIDGGAVAFDVELGYPARSQEPALRERLEAAARTVPGVERVHVQISTKIAAHAVQRGVSLLPGVKTLRHAAIIASHTASGMSLSEPSPFRLGSTRTTTSDHSLGAPPWCQVNLRSPLLSQARKAGSLKK